MRIPSTPGRSRLIGTGVVMAVPVALALAACSSHSTPAAGSTSSPAKHSVTTHSAAPSPTSKAPKHVASDNVRKAVVAGACTHDGSKGWLLKGTVTNSSASARGYSIVVDFMAAKGGTVLDSKTVKISAVAPKSSKAWQVLGAVGKASVHCVIRQVQAH